MIEDEECLKQRKVQSLMRNWARLTFAEYNRNQEAPALAGRAQLKRLEWPLFQDTLNYSLISMMKWQYSCLPRHAWWNKPDEAVLEHSNNILAGNVVDILVSTVVQLWGVQGNTATTTGICNGFLAKTTVVYHNYFAIITSSSCYAMSWGEVSYYLNGKGTILK